MDHQPTAVTAQVGAEALDLGPMTWRGMLPAYLVLIEHGTAEGKALARTELERMAATADKGVELMGGRGSPEPKTETLTHLSIPQLRRMNRVMFAGEVVPDDEQDAIRFRELETWGLMETVPGYVTGYKLTGLGVEALEAYDAYARESTPGGEPETALKAVLARVTRTVTHA